jgi:hypothetical protein
MLEKEQLDLCGLKRESSWIKTVAFNQKIKHTKTVWSSFQTVFSYSMDLQA